MKSLKNFLEEYLHRYDVKVEYDELDNIVLDHCYIHYYLNYRKPIERTIYESDGAFPGEHELVEKICSKINKNHNKKSTFVFNVNNNVVDKIHIYLNKNSDIDGIDGGYVTSKKIYDDYNDVRWDNDRKRFKFGEIHVFNYHLDPEGLEEMLYHELKHMWDDYIEVSKKGTFLSDKVNKSLLKKFENSNMDEIFKKILYYTEDFEISAYIAQINGVLKDNSFVDIKLALDEIIKKSPTYNNYKELYSMIHNDKCINSLKEYFSNKEISKIRKNIDHGWKKIINHTYIICGKYTDKSEIDIYTNRRLNINKWIKELK